MTWQHFILACLLLTGWFAITALSAYVKIPADNLTSFNQLVGAWTIATGGALGWFFNSSYGSNLKTKLMNAVNPKPAKRALPDQNPDPIV